MQKMNLQKIFGSYQNDWRSQHECPIQRNLQTNQSGLRVARLGRAPAHRSRTILPPHWRHGGCGQQTHWNLRWPSTTYAERSTKAIHRGDLGVLEEAMEPILQANFVSTTSGMSPRKLKPKFSRAARRIGGRSPYEFLENSYTKQGGFEFSRGSPYEFLENSYTKQGGF